MKFLQYIKEARKTHQALDFIADQLSNNDKSSDAELVLHLAKQTKNSTSNMSKLVKKERSKFLKGVVSSKDARKLITKYIKTGWEGKTPEMGKDVSNFVKERL